MRGYITIEGQATAEIEEKKSRFIGHVRHVETEDDALAMIEEVRSEHRMARHNVYAYVLRDEGSSERVRYTDDGEPQKTAGLPTLEAIRHASLTDVCLVTTRYFGGTLLGTGGLVRAYTQAAQAAIEAAQVVEVSRCVDVSVTLPYPLYDLATRIANDCGAKAMDTQFTDQVLLRLRMLEGTQEPLLAKLAEILKGSEGVAVSEPFDAML